MVTVDADVFSVTKECTQVLLIQRGHEPFKGLWAFPGGFLEMDEELAPAAARELKEETSLTGVKLNQLYTAGTIGRDPRGRMITVVFMGIIDGPPPDVKGGDDAVDAKWFDIDDMPNVGFDHSEMAKKAIEKLNQM